MSDILDDGTVISHFLSVGNSNPDASGYRDGLNELNLRPGEIIAAYPPSSKKSVSKKFYEYDVMVYEQEGSACSAPTIYPHCQIKDMFGSATDFCRFTPRITKVERDGRKSSYSSRVLVQCPNGDKSTAVIVGFLKHDLLYGEKGKEKEDLGHNFEIQFNGLNCIINKDGEFHITRNGATKADGKYESDDDHDQKGGMNLIFNKEGGMKMASGDKDQYIEINHKDKKITLDASEGIKLGGEDEPLVLGKTYCDAEDSFMNDLFNGFQQLSTAISTLTGAIGALASTPAGGPLPNAGAAATAAGQMGSAVGNLISAVKTFQANVQGGKNAKVLSTKNTTK